METTMFPSVCAGVAPLPLPSSSGTLASGAIEAVASLKTNQNDAASQRALAKFYGIPGG